MAKYIKDKGWKRNEIITTTSEENLDFGDEQEMELADTTIYSKELLNKMQKDENLRRFYLYQQGEDYNIYGEHGSLDTWFTRDGLHIFYPCRSYSRMVLCLLPIFPSLC